MQPLVSVVIPCFNLGQYLQEAVDSVRSQTLKAVELLVVDDGSTDETTRRALEAIETAGANVIRLAHVGVCAARNRGLAAATGSYVCFLDADDRLRPTCLEKAVARLEADPTLSFVSFWLRIFGAEEWDWTPSSCDAVALLGECCVATAAVVRRESLIAIGGFDATSELGHEDWDLWLTLVEKGYQGTILPEILFDYRRRAGSRSEIADSDTVYLALLRERFRKHEALHRAHLAPLLVEKDRRASQLAASPPATPEIAWILERRRAEVELLRNRLLHETTRIRETAVEVGVLDGVRRWLGRR